MKTKNLKIDPYLFEVKFKNFKEFVEKHSRTSFESFASNPYTEKQEGYKYEIYRIAREKLAFQAWKKSDIGSGDIISSAIEAIEIKNNNLVQWHSKHGDKNRHHHLLYEAKKSSIKVRLIEKSLFKLYHYSDVKESFSELIDIFGKKYPLIAYFFFLKDKSKYLPIAPSHFDKSFESLGVRFKTSKRCSWENYSQYLYLINQLKGLLSECLSTEVSILDAHSFAWILSSQMKAEKSEEEKKYLSLSKTERDAIVKARIGQGQFRERLIGYWKGCAITGCQEPKLLKASHIKPWSKSKLEERLHIYNGLLLSPTLDACFDSGLISFDNCGKILISTKFNEKDMKALGINKDMKLSAIKPGHQKYLAYHRENIFRK